MSLTRSATGRFFHRVVDHGSNIAGTTRARFSSYGIIYVNDDRDEISLVKRLLMGSRRSTTVVDRAIYQRR